MEACSAVGKHAAGLGAVSFSRKMIKHTVDGIGSLHAVNRRWCQRQGRPPVAWCLFALFLLMVYSHNWATTQQHVQTTSCCVGGTQLVQKYPAAVYFGDTTFDHCAAAETNNTFEFTGTDKMNMAHVQWRRHEGHNDSSRSIHRSADQRANQTDSTLNNLSASPCLCLYFESPTTLTSQSGARHPRPNNVIVVDILFYGILFFHICF